MSLSTTHPRWAPYVFLAPFLLTFGVFMLYPLAQAVGLAFVQSYGPRHTVFVGLDNFRNLFADKDFWIALRNTFTYTVAGVAIQLPLALGLAMLLNRPGLIARSLFRLIYFSPSLVGVVFVAMMFALLFGDKAGLINVGLRAVFPSFPEEFPWLQKFVMPALIIASLWMYVGFNMVYFLAALQNVPRESLEAAAIDGANAWHRFLHVTLPEIRPVAGFVLLLSIIGSLQLFELPFVLLDGPGPEKRGLTMVMYLYQNGFERNDLGFASATGWVMALILITLAVAQRKLLRDES
jgi:ABC-type sugar transport system permease subunit